MAADNITRRLAAIVSVDVVGYSRLMGVDEEGTLAALRALRASLVDPKIDEHGGRIVKTMGDGLLIEFPSVVEATQCSVEIQRELAVINVDTPEDTRIEVRIGINLGDIIIQDDDIFGDGVNVAARVQELATPGGICVPRSVRDQVRDRIDLAFEDLGEVEVKNIARPIRVFRILLDEDAQPTVRPKKSATWRMAALAVVALVLVLGAAGWWFKPWRDDVAALMPGQTALPDKPSIAVIPFDNLSADATQQYFADGMAEDIITDLSKISGLFVIARNSSFQYRGRSLDLRQVARELGVRNVLEGSVRRAGEQIRINVQLIDGKDGNHIWAERYDGTLADIFALQDKVTAEIITALAVELTADDRTRTARRDTESVEAHDLFLKGWAHYIQTTPEDYRAAIPYLEKAIARDPNYSQAQATLAALYTSMCANHWDQKLGLTPDDAEERSILFLNLAYRSPVPLAHQVRSYYHIKFRRYDQAIAEADKAIALNANDPAGYVALALALVYAGEPQQAVPLVQQAMRLDPNFPAGDLYILAQAHFGLKHYAEALTALERARRLAPDHLDVMSYLIATYGHLRRAKDAEPIIAKLKILEKGRLTRTYLIRLSVMEPLFVNYRKKSDTENYRQGLRLGGLPEFFDEWKFNRADRLSGEELRRISFGRTYKGEHPKSKLPFTITRSADGHFSAEGLWNGTGTSRIDGTRLCNYWDKYKTETCAVVYRNAASSKAGRNQFTLIQRSGVYTFATYE